MEVKRGWLRFCVRGRARHALLCVLLLMLGETAVAAPWLQVEIYVPDATMLRNVFRAGADPEGVEGRVGGPMRFVVQGEALGRLEAAGIPFRVVVKDLEQFYAERLASQEMRPADFGYGSMGGYYTLDEVVSQLDTLRILFPFVVSGKESIGVSVQGRTVWAVKMTADPDAPSARPRVFYNSLTHAREPAGMMTVLYFMWHLARQFQTDPSVTYLLRNRELWFVPVVNPDGYEANRRMSPTGGGMRRKNMRDAAADGDANGVDLNRNYGYQWGWDDIGSSPVPTDIMYRGPSAFSEPETRAIRDFCIDKAFSLALNYHTYSNVLIYPWSYLASTETPDSLLFREYAREMTRVNRYSYGTGDQLIGYWTNGDADDWMYGEQSAKPKIIAMTPELGNASDGFWPPASRILPLAEENLSANLFLAWAAGGFPGVATAVVADSSGDGYVEPGERFTVTTVYRNRGLGPATDLRVKASSAGASLVMDPIVHQVNTLAARSDTLLTFGGRASMLAVPGEKATIVLSTSIGMDEILFDEIVVTPGKPLVAFADDFETTFAAWDTSGGWGASGLAHSGERSVTESPGGNYPDLVERTLVTRMPLPLPATASAVRLAFWTRWEIEPSWDFGRVEVSADSGKSWSAMAGNHTIAGSGRGAQIPAGVPGYDGRQVEWVEEEIDLATFKGKEILVRFRFQSDDYVTQDGWYVDDVRILSYGSPTSVDEVSAGVPGRFELLQNFPNPFNPTTEIRYQVSGVSNVKLVVYDILGREVAVLVNEKKAPGTYEVRVDASDLASGVYLYRLSAGTFVQTRKMILMH